ncbi:MAG: MBL fold metallo-hydrolase [Halanaerobiaceae bacterium]
MGLKISVLCSGSSGNSIYIEGKSVKILVDAGMSGKKMSGHLEEIGAEAREIDAILLTHEHKDHIQGAGVLSRRYDIPIYTTEKTWEEAGSDLGEIESCNQCLLEEEFLLGGLEIQSFATSHDACDPRGYIIRDVDAAIGIATDTGRIPDGLQEKFHGLDCMVVESNHDLEMLMTGSYPWALKKRIRSNLGHLSNDDAAALLPEVVGSNRPLIFLAHLSEDNNIPDLALITVKNNLEDKGISVGEDVRLTCANRNHPTRLYEVG